MSTGYVEGEERTQATLFPNTLDEYVGKENPVRFIDAFVSSLDLNSLGFKHAEPNVTGRHPYDPADILKLIIYGYLNQTRTSRKLERECHRNVEVMWMMKKLAPDFKTISDFRKNNIECIKPVFKEFVFLCRGLDLFGGELVGIDSVKLKAVNSKSRNFDRKKLEARLKQIGEAVERYLGELDESDRKDEEEEQQEEGQQQQHSDPGITTAEQQEKDYDDNHASPTNTGARLKEKIQKLEQKKEEYSNLLEKLKDSKEREISLTDPDSRLTKNNGKMEVGYNTVVAVDSKNHLIPDYNVTNVAGDGNLLSGIAKSAKEILGVEILDATADKGFFSAEQFKKCLESGITPYVPEPKFIGAIAKRKGIPAREFYKDKFNYDKETDTYTCPAGQKLEFRHVMKIGRGDVRVRAYGTQACRTCPFFITKCTTNKDGRKIHRGMDEEFAEEMRRRIKDNPSKVKIRKELCEHPFGTIKRGFNQGYLLLKGLRKVKGEVGFTMLAYNMRRAINLVGTRDLIASLRL